jgi:hypothetical protein
MLFKTRDEGFVRVLDKFKEKALWNVMRALI